MRKIILLCFLLAFRVEGQDSPLNKAIKVKLDDGVLVFDYVFSSPLNEIIAKKISAEAWENAERRESLMGAPIASISYGKEKFMWYGGFVAKRESKEADPRYTIIRLPELKGLDQLYKNQIVTGKKIKKSDIQNWENKWIEDYKQNLK